MPRAVSELSVHSRHPGLGPRSRPAGAEARPPASPFAQLLDDATEAPPAPPKDHSERAQAGSTAATAKAGASRSDNATSDKPAAQTSKTATIDQQPTGATAPAAAGATPEDGKTATDDDGVANGDSPAMPTATVEVAATTVSSTDPAAAQPAATPPITPPATAIPVPPTIGSAVPDESTDSAQLADLNDTTKNPAPGPKPAGKTGAATPAVPPASQTAGAAQTADTPGTPNEAHSPPAGETPATAADPAAGETRGDAHTPPASAPQDPRHAHLNAVPAIRSEDAAETLRELSAPHIDARSGTAASAANPAADGTQVVGMQRPTGPLGAPAAPAAAADTTPVPIAGLAVEIAARAQAGRNRFEIRLDPPELGRIDVRLDVDNNGQVTSRLLVERSETLDMLRRDAGELDRALQQAGLKTADNGMQFALRDQGFAGRNDNAMPPHTARLIVPDPDLALGETMQDYGRVLRIGGGIDIRV